MHYKKKNIPKFNRKQYLTEIEIQIYKNQAGQVRREKTRTILGDGKSKNTEEIQTY